MPLRLCCLWRCGLVRLHSTCLPLGWLLAHMRLLAHCCWGYHLAGVAVMALA